jgi:putative DNA primase/helicase
VTVIEINPSQSGAAVIPIRPDLAAGASGDWRDEFVYKITRNGRVIDDVTSNAIVVFRREPEWQGVIAYDELSQSIVRRSPAPWYGVDSSEAATRPGPWTDMDTTRAQSYLRRKYSIALGVDATRAAVAVAAEAASFNPVKEWMDRLEWDGEARVGKVASGPDLGTTGWLTRYLRAEDCNYVRLIGRWHAIASVARVYDPGCKVDTVPIAEAGQGKKKSTAIRALYHPWFSDTPLDLGSKDKYESLFGVWGYELAEFDQYNRHEAAVLKAFASKQEDKFRRAYGRSDTWNPRRVVFMASVNPSKPYINDETGGRRWHPFRTSVDKDKRDADVDGIWREREAFWAEARELYLCWAREREASCRWWPEEAWEKKLCEREQADRQSGDVWLDKIAAHLVGHRSGSVVKTGDILSGCLNIEPAKWDEKNSDRVQKCLRQLGWVRTRDTTKGEDGTRGYHYVRP